MENDPGQNIFDQEAVFVALQTHWAKVFEGRGVDQSAALAFAQAHCIPFSSKYPKAFSSNPLLCHTMYLEN